MSEPEYREVKAEEERRLLRDFGYWDIVAFGALVAGFGAFAFRTHDEHADLYSSVVSLAQPNGHIVLRRRAELEDETGNGDRVEQGNRFEPGKRVGPSPVRSRNRIGHGGRRRPTCDHARTQSARRLSDRRGSWPGFHFRRLDQLCRKNTLAAS